jgi:hypothetical protein
VTTFCVYVKVFSELKVPTQVGFPPKNPKLCSSAHDRRFDLVASPGCCELMIRGREFSDGIIADYVIT